MSDDWDRDRRRNRSSRSRSRSPRRRRDRESPGRPSGGHSKMVYISNIPYDVRWMELKDLIREKAGDVSFVEMLEGPDGKPKGCAVVEFKDREMVTKCVEVMHRMPIRDRNLVVKEIREPERFFRKVKEETGIDFLANRSGGQGLGGGGGGGGRGGHAPNAAVAVNYETYGLSPTFLKQLGIDGPLCNRVFAANLPYHVGPSKLKELFGLAGSITDVDLQLDTTGKNKGLAVIEYTHPIEAVQSISMLHNQKFHDRNITVKMDKFDKPQELRRPGELPAGMKTVGMGLGANGAPLTNVAQLIGGGTGTNGSSFSQTIGGYTGGANLAQFGSSALYSTPGNVTGSLLSSNNVPSLGAVGTGGLGGGTGAGGGLYGGAGLSSLLGGSATGGAAATPWGGGGTGGSLNAFGSVGLSTAMDGGGSAGGFRGSGGSALLNSATGGSYERARDFDRAGSPGSHSMRQARSIIIRNLPLDYSWQTLRDRLRGFGEVEYADICSPGVGRVRFKTAMDAEKAAVNLNGMIVEGHPITVDLAVTD